MFTHVSDIHGQPSPTYQIYYDNPHSRADLNFDGADRLIKRGGRVPVLTAKLNALRAAYDDRVLVLICGIRSTGAPSRPIQTAVPCIVVTSAALGTVF